jgi:molybdopterin/thiamine biosynthesis adenylyltransferase
MARFAPDQLDRYKRHLLLDGVGAKGQQKLLDARVLLIGAGGLGSPAALYLAAAGVGTLRIAEFDVVDASNLQRQVLYTTADVGSPKIDAASARLRALNPDLRVEPCPEKLVAANAREILSGCDVIVDGTDTFPSRYLSNDFAVWLGIPLVYGSIQRFEGQVSVFDSGAGGPCYRCLFPEPPPPDLAPS